MTISITQRSTRSHKKQHMPTLTSLHADLLVLIRALLTDYEVVQLRFSCRHLLMAVQPPKTTQLCPGTWRVPQTAITDEMRDRVYEVPLNTLQWGYLLDFSGGYSCNVTTLKDIG